MGQRIQIICKLPSYKINEGNPNNRGEEWLVFHNQWLWGIHLLDHLADILDNFVLIRNDEKRSGHHIIPPDYKEMLNNAVASANYKNPTNIRRTHRYFPESDENDNLAMGKWGNWRGLFDALDNNNGFAFLKVSRTGDIGFDILNGTEDAPIIKRRTPLEYLKLFDYKKEDYESKWMQRLLKRLQKYTQIQYTTLGFPSKKAKADISLVNKTVKVKSYKRGT